MSGGIYFGEFEHFTPAMWAGFWIGVAVMFFGLFLLSPDDLSEDDAPPPDDDATTATHDAELCGSGDPPPPRPREGEGNGDGTEGWASPAGQPPDGGVAGGGGTKKGDAVVIRRTQVAPMPTTASLEVLVPMCDLTDPAADVSLSTRIAEPTTLAVAREPSCDSAFRPSVPPAGSRSQARGSFDLVRRSADRPVRRSRDSPDLVRRSADQLARRSRDQPDHPLPDGALEAERSAAPHHRPSAAAAAAVAAADAAANAAALMTSEMTPLGRAAQQQTTHLARGLMRTNPAAHTHALRLSAERLAHQYDDNGERAEEAVAAQVAGIMARRPAMRTVWHHP